VIPAVDLLGDEAVRLERGAYDRVRVRAGSPEALVRRFVAFRPSLIHVVDLDGARSGTIRRQLVARLVGAAGSVPVQVSGGIRSVGDARALLEAGAARVVVATAAFERTEALPELVGELGARLVVAVDARGGRVAVAGWERESGMAVEEAVDRCVAAGVARLHCTAIDRDGTMAGPDVALLRRVAERFSGPVVAAGGIRSPDDLTALAELGLEGAVVGRALLEGSVPLSALTAGR
jgi:phosphoribosylformimino-5-aminoimidazole carboxamide ribotide isomerase